jgi:UDP-N-acetylmuramate dehydrogenase
MTLMATDRNIIGGELRGKLGELPGCRVSFDEPLARHSSMGTGGPADVLCWAGTLEGLKNLLALLTERRLAWVAVGQGTNLLFPDSGLRGAVIKLEGEFKRLEHEGKRLRAGAGVSLSSLLEGALQHGLGGLEFAVGIPGSVGGAVIGNAGTPEESLGDRVEWVELLTGPDSIRRAGSGELKFAYRSSNVSSLGGIVLSAELNLEGRPREISARLMSQYAERKKGQPVDWPNVGCIFKNPPGFSAGRLIDEAGLKGSRSGGAEISKRHANFIINRGGAMTADIVALIEHVHASVLESAGLTLEPEILLLDESGRRLSLPGQRPC